MKNSMFWKEFAKTLSIFLVLSGAVCVANVRAQDCSTTTDAQLVTTIYDQVKADKVLGPQISHIIIGSVNRFVKLQGWTDSKNDYDRLQDLVSKVPCVVAINVNRFEETPPPPNSPLRPQPSGCGPGMKACGDVCIPEGDACSDRTKSGSDE